MYKKKLISSIIFIFILSFFASGAKSDSNQQIELKLSAFMPPFAPQVKVYKEWADKIAEKTGGRVKITIFPAGTLLSPQDVIPGITAGTADMADFTISSTSDQFPLTPTLTLPFMPLGNAESGYKIWMELQKKFPEMKNEFKDFKVLFRATTGSYALHTAKKPARLPEDLKGVKIMVGGMGDVMNKLNAAAMQMPLTDWYMSLERGLLEAMWMNWQAVYEMKCYEFLKYHTAFPSGCTLGMSQMIMNLDSWNKLSPADQKAFEDLSEWATNRIRQLAEIEAAEKAKKAMKDAGHTFITLTPAEEKKWRDVADPVIEVYLAKVEARGLPARAVYKQALELAKKYNK